MKFNYSTFIGDLIIDKSPFNCNVNVILIKIKSAINIINADTYKKKDLYIY